MPEHPIEPGGFALNDQAPMSAGISSLGSREDAETGEARKLASLLEISKALSGTLRVKTGIQQALEILERHHGAFRSIGNSSARR